MAEQLEIAEKWIQGGHRPGIVLRSVGVNSSTYYYRHSREGGQAKKHGGGRPAPGICRKIDGAFVSDEQVKEWICEMIAGEGYAYGYLKLTVCLRRKHGLLINKKKVYRLCKELHLLRPQRKKKTKHPRRLARNRIVTGPNQLWETDIKYGYIQGERHFFFVMSLLDVYDRSVVYSHIGLSATGEDAAAALGHALWNRHLIGNGPKPALRSDNGPQFTADAFDAACKRYGVEHERIPCRTPNKNAHIEAFHRILEDECLSGQEFETFTEAYRTVAEFLEFYNKVRIHSSIQYMAPEEFYKAFQSKDARLLPIKV